MTDRGRDIEGAEEARFRELMGTLADDVSAPAGFRADVMRAIEAELTEPWWKRLADWWIQPQPVRIRPAFGALALAAALVVLSLLPRGEVGVGSGVATAPAQPVTRFVLVAPGASSVHLTGDFVAWSPEGIALEDPRGTGVWTTDVTLPPGVYQYTFVVNGTEWTPDPQAVSQVDDGFGQLNSVLIVPGGEA